MVKMLAEWLRSVNWIYKLSLSFSRLFSKKLNTKKLECFFLFIGYPRSGHTLVGAMLDAHPNILCSIESNALLLFTKGYSRKLLFFYIEKRSKLFVRKFNAMWTGYSYKIEGAWQGETNELMAIGDKKGAGTTKLLSTNRNLLANFEKNVELPLKIVHVIRNPFDNLATIMLRAAEKGKNCNEDFFNQRIEYYHKHVLTNQKIIADNPNKVLSIYHEDLIAQPTEELKRILKFLNMPITSSYLEKCSKSVNASPHKSRHKIDWPKDLKAKVELIISEVDFLKRYSWDD